MTRPPSRPVRAAHRAVAGTYAGDGRDGRYRRAVSLRIVEVALDKQPASFSGLGKLQFAQPRQPASVDHIDREDDMMNLVEHSNLIRERSKQPVVIAGATFVPTVEFAHRIGYSANYLHKLAAEHPVNNEVVAVRGWRFIRLPRHKGDLHPPIFWQVKA